MTAATRSKPRKVTVPLSKQRLRLWLRLLRASRAIENELRERLRTAFDVTLPQFDVMAALARAGDGMMMGELSRALMVSNGNVTGIIDRLVADGHVVRESPPGDRRSIQVRLTPRGAERFGSMAVVHEAWIDELLASLDRAQIEEMIGSLDGLGRRIRDGGRAP